ncbi:MAG TPA: hypothetical protein VFE37_23240 [Chloroflexota bacterium]|nr:hypothetical protein [Chloroflexota bacterium]
MAKFSTVSMKEARESVLPPRRATQERYREYVRQVGTESAGRLDLEANDRPITERARLKAAAKSEGVNLYIQRRGNTIVFWQTQEAPKPRGGGARGRKRS